MYTLLDAGKIIETAEKLRGRIVERFPGSGLSKVSAEVVSVARSCRSEAVLLGAAHRPIRWLVGGVIAAGLLCAALVASSFQVGHVEGEAVALVPILEPAMNIAILVGLGVLALTRLESNWKRRRALHSLHGLRSLAHVIDMHQLTKDPNEGRWALPSTPSSPNRDLSEAALVRYLDYCSELLSVIAKLAALYAQSHQDPALVQSVNEIEVLTTNLSRKIWQKIAFVAMGPVTRPAESSAA